METQKFEPKVMKVLLAAQKNEITEQRIYEQLARRIRDDKNRQILQRIASDEDRHYEFYKTLTGRDVGPARLRVFAFYWVCRLLGITFGIKLLERGEAEAQDTYATVSKEVPGVQAIIEDEDEHEQELIALIEEEKLQYVGSMVLGLNDALVELTGALAGLSLALRNTRLIALAGLVTGIAASFSMAASEYLSKKSEDPDHPALKSAAYTGVAYIVTVFFLVLPYLFVAHYLLCLGLTLGIAILIILFFNYYISVAKDLPFARRFWEMAGISLGVAALSFGIGYVIRIALGVEV